MKRMGFIANLLRWLKGVKKDPRFANQPAWLKAEMLDKAAQKRKMRRKKRLLNAAHHQ